MLTLGSAAASNRETQCKHGKEIRTSRAYLTKLLTLLLGSNVVAKAKDAKAAGAILTACSLRITRLSLVGIVTQYRLSLTDILLDSRCAHNAISYCN